MSTTTEEVLYTVADGIASVTLHRPGLHNALHAQMVHAFEAAFRRAAADPAVKVIVLRGAGRHFSVGHEGTASGSGFSASAFGLACAGQFPHADEQEAYLAICQRWRELAKPTIAMVQGACLASGLMLAQACDLVLAAEDAVFSNPVLRTSQPGLGWFARADEFHPRIAKEFLFLGERMNAQRAYQMGLVNRVMPPAFLEEETYCTAWRIAQMPAAGLAVVKQAINRAGNAPAAQPAAQADLAAHF